MNNQTFMYVTYIATTKEKLWDALTKTEFTEQYFFGTKIESDWQVGSDLNWSREGVVTDFGKVLAYEPYRLLSFTFTNASDKVTRQEPTRVTYELKEMGGTVRLTLKHEHLLAADYVESQDTFQGYNNGWPAILSNLKSFLETGSTLPPIIV